MSFKEIYAEYLPKVYRICMGYVNDPDHAKDLTQDTFIAVWKNISSFRHESNIGTWIFRIATNTCLRALEKSQRVATSELPMDLAEETHAPIEEKLALLYKCISELDEVERIIISLALENLPQTEIASVVGMSHSNIRVKIHRIKERLALKMKDYERFN